MNSGPNSGKQRGRTENLRAHQFKPGQSGNLKGRPRTRGLIVALKAALAEVQQDGRTVEQALIDALVREALRGQRKLSAIGEIFDRLEGKAKQQVDVKDITEELRGRSDEDLLHYAEHGKWLEEKQHG